MSLQVARRPKRTQQSNNKLQEALDDFQQRLTTEERTRFRQSYNAHDASSVALFAAKLDREDQKRSGRSWMSRLNTFLSSVQQFSQVVGIFVSSDPTVAALVWGSVRFMLQIAINVSSFFDKLSSFLLSIEGICPRFAEYQLLFQHSVKLQQSLCNFYAEVIRCCTKVCQLLRNHRWSTALRSIVISFDTEFGPSRLTLKQLAQDVEYQIRLAADKADDHERMQSSTHRSYMKRFTQRTDEKLSDIKDVIGQRNEARACEQLLSELSDYNHEKSLLQGCSRRYNRTAEWFVEEPEFKALRAATTSRSMWLTGKLGCGKTVLISSMITYLTGNARETGVSYFFCDFSDKRTLSALTILRSIIRQCFGPDSIPQKFREPIRQVFNAVQASSLGDLLDFVISDSLLKWIVIDGIDECTEPERQSLLRVLKRAVQKALKPIKLLISSRNEAPLFFKKQSNELVPYIVRYSAIDADIETYVASVVSPDAEEGFECGNPNLRSDVEKALVEGADSMFLWVVLQVNEIRCQDTDRDIRRALKTLPKTLEETYLRIMARIGGTGNELNAKRTMQMVAGARRPLRLDEINEALAVELYAASSQADRLVNDESRILRRCEGALIWEEIGYEVRFAHPSVVESLTRSANGDGKPWFHIDRIEADKELGKICATYLNFSHFKNQVARRSKLGDIDAEQVIQASIPPNQKWVRGQLHKFSRSYSGDSRSEYKPMEKLAAVGKLQPDITEASHTASYGQAHPFLAYAKDYWLLHAWSFREDDQIWRFWQRLVHDYGEFLPRPWSASDRASWDTSYCSYIATHNHFALLRLSLQESSSPPPRASRQIFAGAMEQKNYDLGGMILQLWIANGDIDDDSCQEIWLQSTNLDSMPELISHQLPYIDIDRRFERPFRGQFVGWTMLQIASQWGELERVKSLIADNADVNAAPAPVRGLTALQAAAGSGHLEVVNQLLAANADINATIADWGGRTALQGASENGHLEIVEQLLVGHADVNAESAAAEGRTALQAAAEGGFLEVVERLLAAAADVNALPRDKGRTALQAAAGSGHLDVVKRLIAVNANLNAAAGNRGRTALQAAAEGGYLEVVKHLLAADADVNAAAAAAEGRTALQAAAGGGYLEVVQRLLEAKANVNADAAAIEGRTALQAAAGGGHLGIVEQLITAGANVNASAADGGRTALQAAAEGGHLTIVERLLKAEALVDVEAPIINSALAFFARAGGGNLDAESDVDVPVTNKKWGMRTALEAAAGGGHLEIVERLLAAKADVNACAAVTSTIQRTALQAAAGGGHLKVVERLLAASADNNAGLLGKGGLTALQAAEKGGHVEIVQRLREAGAK